MKRLVHDALSREGRVTVDQDTHHLNETSECVLKLSPTIGYLTAATFLGPERENRFCLKNNIYVYIKATRFFGKEDKCS